jgi:hypothetical protein
MLQFVKSLIEQTYIFYKLIVTSDMYNKYPLKYYPVRTHYKSDEDLIEFE